MMRSMPYQNVPKRKFRSKIFRDQTERDIVDKIASFFDEKNKALSLLKRNINNGYISTPDKDMPIQEFLKVQQEAWVERQSLRIPHSIQFLRNSIPTKSLTSAYFCHGYPRLGNLDMTEGNRETADGPSQFREDQ